MGYSQRVLLAALNKLVSTGNTIHAKAESYFHGTTSLFGEKILKSGFKSNPNNKVWVDDSEALAQGVYLTLQPQRAALYAIKAIEKFKGKAWIFEVNIDPSMGMIDEDELDLHGVLQNYVKKGKGDEDSLTQAAKAWFEEMNRWLGKEVTIPASIENKVVQLAKEWARSLFRKDIQGSKQARKEIMHTLKGQVKNYHFYNVVMPDIDKQQIVSIIQLEVKEKKLTHTVIYGKPSREFLGELYGDTCSVGDIKDGLEAIKAA
jgi:hypothetical protein